MLNSICFPNFSINNNQCNTNHTCTYIHEDYRQKLTHAHVTCAKAIGVAIAGTVISSVKFK